MTTLDYIPGSSFLGIVAGQIYKEIGDERAYEIFHSGKVSFGDALVSDTDASEMSYAIPFSLFKDKTGKGDTLVHHFLTECHYAKQQKDGIQLKQERSGYLTPGGGFYKNLQKNMALKSAQDREQRRSKDRAMYGFESLEKGQTFIFSIRFFELTHVDIVSKALEGVKKIGKSKTAQYGQVKIEKLEHNPITADSEPQQSFTVVYAESNLCFFNEYGQSTFQPNAQDLGFESGAINWEKSQVRTYSYSPWNYKRNTPNTQRDCILRGSVFYLTGEVGGKSESQASVGEYVAEGLGRVIYNPAFLSADSKTAVWRFNPTNKSGGKEGDTQQTSKEQETPLGKYLLEQKNAKKNELQLSEAVKKAMILDSSKKMRKISASQWGGIRAHARNQSDASLLRDKLFKDFLKHGVAYDKYWGKNGEQYLRDFQRIFEDNISLGADFVVKYATEMAKEAEKLKRNQQ